MTVDDTARTRPPPRRLRRALETALAVLLGGALCLLPFPYAPLTAGGALIGVLISRPWRRKQRNRGWLAIGAAATVGGTAGAMVEGTVLGPFGPKVYAGLLSRLLRGTLEGLFVGGVMIGGGAVLLAFALWPSATPRAPTRGWVRGIKSLGRVAWLFACLGTWVGLPGREATDAFYVERAWLVEPALYQVALDSMPDAEDPDDDALPVRGHRMAEGAGIVFAYRWYSPGNWSIIDDEDFEKLTVMVPVRRLDDRGVIELDNTTRAIAAYTRGGSAWPRLACYGRAASGTLRYRRLPLRRILVDVSLTVEAVSPRQSCDGAVVEKRLILEPRTLESLSPWLGGCAGGSLYAETYRRRRACMTESGQ